MKESAKQLIGTDLLGIISYLGILSSKLHFFRNVSVRLIIVRKWGDTPDLHGKLNLNLMVKLHTSSIFTSVCPGPRAGTSLP